MLFIIFESWNFVAYAILDTNFMWSFRFLIHLMKIRQNNIDYR